MIKFDRQYYYSCTTTQIYRSERIFICKLISLIKHFKLMVGEIHASMPRSFKTNECTPAAAFLLIVSITALFLNYAPVHRMAVMLLWCLFFRQIVCVFIHALQFKLDKATEPWFHKTNLRSTVSRKTA